MRRRLGVYAVLGVLLYLVALIVTVLLCLVFVSPAPAKPHPKGGKGKHDAHRLPPRSARYTITEERGVRPRE